MPLFFFGAAIDWSATMADLTNINVPSKRPDVFKYTNYRLFLGDMYNYLKVNQRGFSYRNFSRRAELSSPNHLKQVIDGRIGLSSPRIIGKFAKGLELTSAESHYFETLVISAGLKGDEDCYFVSLSMPKESFETFKTKLKELMREVCETATAEQTEPLRVVLTMKDKGQASQ
jgi:hypothetical protein